MTVRVQAFARVREILGASSMALELAEGADVRELFQALVARSPGLAHLEERLLVAVNEEYAPWDRTLADGDRVALIPPVSGG